MTVDAPDPWSTTFAPPPPLVTERVCLEPLAPRHAELDHAALMGSRARLRRSFPWGGWPRDDFTVDENRSDLERHWREFERREAYAYTVLSPDRARCLGCIYLGPLERGDGPREPRHASLMFWVVDDERPADLDRHLAASVIAWLAEAWPLDAVGLFAPVQDDRSAIYPADLDLVEQSSPVPGQRLFLRNLR